MTADINGINNILNRTETAHLRLLCQMILQPAAKMLMPGHHRYFLFYKAEIYFGRKILNFRLFIFYFLSAVSTIFAGCSASQQNMSQNTVVNINSINTSENTNNQANMTINDKKDSNAPAPIPVNKKTLTSALKVHLKNVKEDVLTEKDWNGDLWLDLGLGLFYKKDDEFVRDDVCRVTIAMLEMNNERMTKSAQKKLRSSLNQKTKCKEAVALMVDAVADTEKIIKEF